MRHSVCDRCHRLTDVEQVDGEDSLDLCQECGSELHDITADIEGSYRPVTEDEDLN